jgi:hypothetical protein
MLVKMLDGRYAGEVRDIENGTALELLRLGRVAHAFNDAIATPSHPVASGGDASAVEPAKAVRHGKKARK